MRVVACDPEKPAPESLELAVTRVRGGGVVAVPTDTFYGLAADGLDGPSVLRVNRLKGKPPGSPVLLLAADLAQVERLARELPPVLASLAATFWPGPLTLVLPAADCVPTEVSGGRRTVAVRVPNLQLVRSLASRLGRPVTGPSANRRGGVPARTADEVVRIFGDELDLVLDGGPASGDEPSTLLDLTREPARLLREGAVSRGRLAPWLTVE